MSKLIFLFVIVTALYLRIQGIKYGFPYVLIEEEANYILRILHIIKHFVDLQVSSTSTCFLYFNSLILLLANKTLDISTILGELELNVGNVLYPLRFLSVLFGVGTVAVVYFIGEFFGFNIALFASGFLAVSFLHVIYSQFFLPFSMVVFFALLSTYFALRAHKEQKIFLYILSIIFSVLCTSTNYIGVVSILPIIFAIALDKRNSKIRPRFLFLLYLILFLILNPFFIFKIPQFFIYIFQSYIDSCDIYSSNTYFLHIFRFLLIGVGPIIWISTLGIIKYKSFNDLNLLKILFCLPVFYLGILGFFHIIDLGFAVLLVPYVCLASGLVFNSLINWYIDSSVRRFIYILLLLFAFYIPLKYTIKYNKLINLSDTRIIASEWIRSNTTSSFKVAWDRNSIMPNWYDAYNKTELKKLVLDPDSLIDRQRFLITERFLKNKNWFKALRKKTDYVAINSLDYERSLRSRTQNYKKKYYLKILKLQEKPVIVFNPFLREKEKQIRLLTPEELYLPFSTLWQRERAGPLIKIYKL